MGYSTDFYGEVRTDKPIDEETFQLLKGLRETRRMKRDPAKLAKRLKMTKKAVLEKYGEYCEFWVGDTDNYGQDTTPDVVNSNGPPRTQPSLWLQWEIQEDHQTIQWDGGEKFYDYISWMEYIIERILKPRGYVVNGDIEWQGEARDDSGMIVVTANVVTVKTALTYYLSEEDHKRVSRIVDDYLNHELKEVIDDKLDRM